MEKHENILLFLVVFLLVITCFVYDAPNTAKQIAAALGGGVLMYVKGK